ncbi:MAG: thioredoxin family protein [Erysipelotrichaceae bacterium]|nr:thioredoxin family protein [Erysipelotrichaceae bacterium]
MKKLIIVSTILLLTLTGCSSLPKPSIESGIRGELGIDKNINESTIDNYLGREDTVYIDLRMLKDEANYEAIGGDSYLSGFINGFEVVPYPYICNPVGLPEEVGTGYTGEALFTYENGEYKQNYEEALLIVNTLFPKDKTLFLMCGGGGYAGMMKNLLISLGYDENKIYNVGGYWYYEGNNKVEIKKTVNGNEEYDFDLVKYHDIDFDALTPVAGYKPESSKEVDEEPKSDIMIQIDTLQDFNSLINNNKSFLLYVYLPGCVSCASFKPIVEEFMEINDVPVYQLNYKVIKETDNIIKQSISYTPSLFIFKDGKLLSYLNPVGDVDKDKYHSTENLSNWINEYIDVEIVKTNTQNNDSGCDNNACKL